LGNFSDGEQEEMPEVCDMLEKHLTKDCPTMEELVLMFVEKYSDLWYNKVSIIYHM